MKLLLITPCLLVLIFGCRNQKNSIQQRKNDCADATAGVISYEDFFKKYKLGEFDAKWWIGDDILLERFCEFYISK